MMLGIMENTKRHVCGGPKIQLTKKFQHLNFVENEE
jgi:hypothetical protein